MHALRHSNPIGGHDIQFHRVLIDLREERGSRNGERKRLGGLPRAGRSFCPSAQRDQFGVAPEPMHFPTHLSVGGRFDRCSGFLCETQSYLPHLRMLMDGGHCWRVASRYSRRMHSWKGGCMAVFRV